MSTIQKHSKAKEIAQKFSEDTIASNSFGPGTALNYNDTMKPAHRMCSKLCGHDAFDFIRKQFGFDGDCSGKVKKAYLSVFEHEGNIIISKSEVGVGTSWHITKCEPGSRFGQVYYNCCDPEVVNIVPKFSENMLLVFNALKSGSKTSPTP